MQVRGEAIVKSSFFAILVLPETLESEDCWLFKTQIEQTVGKSLHHKMLLRHLCSNGKAAYHCQWTQTSHWHNFANGEMANVKKANSMLGIIKNGHENRTASTITSLYKSMARPCLEYGDG